MRGHFVGGAMRLAVGASRRVLDVGSRAGGFVPRGTVLSPIGNGGVWQGQFTSRSVEQEWLGELVEELEGELQVAENRVEQLDKDVRAEGDKKCAWVARLMLSGGDKNEKVFSIVEEVVVSVCQEFRGQVKNVFVAPDEDGEERVWLVRDGGRAVKFSEEFEPLKLLEVLKRVFKEVYDTSYPDFVQSNPGAAVILCAYKDMFEGGDFGKEVFSMQEMVEKRDEAVAVCGRLERRIQNHMDRVNAPGGRGGPFT